MSQLHVSNILECYQSISDSGLAGLAPHTQKPLLARHMNSAKKASPVPDNEALVHPFHEVKRQTLLTSQSHDSISSQEPCKVGLHDGTQYWMLFSSCTRIEVALWQPTHGSNPVNYLQT
jgi:hypothetical protein